MSDANDGIRWLLQCGISYLFDPNLEGAVKNGCTHRLLSPFFSSSFFSHDQRRARVRGAKITKDRGNAPRSHSLSPTRAFTCSFERRETFRVGIGPTEKCARCSHQMRDVSLATRRLANTRETTCQNRAAPHASGTSTATSSLG